MSLREILDLPADVKKSDFVIRLAEDVARWRRSPTNGLLSLTSGWQAMRSVVLSAAHVFEVILA